MTYPEHPAQQPSGYGQQPPSYDPMSMGYFTPPPPKHGSATTAMILGIVGLAGVVMACGVTLPLSPFAWYMGARAVKEIDAEPGRYAGRSEANAGKITGIIGTVLLALAVVLALGAVAVLFSSSEPSFEPIDSFPTPGTTSNG